jgi:hypothetical protein
MGQCEPVVTGVQKVVDDASVRVDGIVTGRHVGWEHLDQKAHSRGLPADADDDCLLRAFFFPSRA